MRAYATTTDGSRDGYDGYDDDENGDDDDGRAREFASIDAPKSVDVVYGNGADDDERVYARARDARVGPELRELRAHQGASEHYTTTHYDRLYGCLKPWGRERRGGKTWCKDAHAEGCETCSSCHFCRQKTTDVKTKCACGTWKRAPEGGRGRGVWCGWCLEMRVGENLEEALADDEWRCPVCRDICNCSGANCLRAKRNLFPTQQLTHEALTYGWPSVAHYLITTAIVSGRDAPPMLDLPAAFQERRRRQRGEGGGGEGARARGEIAGMFAAANAKEAHAAAVRAKIAERVRAAFGEFSDRGFDGDNGRERDDNGMDVGTSGRTHGGQRGGSRGTARRGVAARNGYESSDGSELNSSDSESDAVDDAVAVVLSDDAPLAMGRHAEPEVSLVDEYLGDGDDVVRPAKAYSFGHARSRPVPSAMATTSRRMASGETSGTRAPAQKRARTTYGDDGRSIEVWSDVEDDAPAPSVERSVADIARDDDLASQIERARASRPTASATTPAAQEDERTSAGHGARAAAEAPPLPRRRRHRRRRLPRHGEAQEFDEVNPEVIANAQMRATRASAQEEDEETRAAEGTGACATILREVRCGAFDETTHRDAMVRSNEALRASMIETESGITIDEAELRAYCALIVRIVRVSAKTHNGDRLISDARESLADAEKFRAHHSTARAILIRALLRCSDHASFQGLQVGESLIQLLTLIAELGQEYCLIRDNMRAKPDESPPPLPDHIQATIADLTMNAANEENAEVLSRDDDVTMILIERLEASHVLLCATMAALRRSVRGPPLAGREELFCPTLAAFLSPSFPFKTSLRKQALRLVAAAFTAATRDWGDPKSAETRALATNASEHIWPAISELLANDFPARSTVPLANLPVGSGVTRAVIEGTARMFALLLRSGVWGWGKAEAAIVAPHTPGTFWRSASPPYRALAVRLYARMLDATPVLYAGVGAPLLKIWALAALDPAADESGATGISRARARLSRAAKRHPVLFAAFPSCEILSGCERSDKSSLSARAGWVAEVLHQAATTSAAPQARIAAIAAANAFWDVLPAREAEVRGKYEEAAFAAASALVLTTAVSHLSDAFSAPPPKIVPMLRKTVQLSATRGARESQSRAATLSHAILAVASAFDTRDSAMITTLIAILHESIERPTAANASDVIWRALDVDDALHKSLGIPNEKVAVLKDFILNACAKRAIERVRYSSTSALATQAANGWANALASLAKTSTSDWLFALMPALLDAMQPPTVPIGKGAAPPPISISPSVVRSALYSVLANVVDHHPQLIVSVKGDDEGADAVSIFFVAIMRAAISEVAHALGGAEESKGYAPLTESDRNAAGRRLRAALGNTMMPTPHVLEEAYRGFTAPAEADKTDAADAHASTPISAAIAALKFVATFAGATPAAQRLVKEHVLSPIKAAMKRKETPARRVLVPYVHDLWAAVGLIQHNSKENTAPAMMDSAPPTPVAKAVMAIARAPWPENIDAPCAFASIEHVPKGNSVNVVGQLARREPKRGVTAKVNPKTGKSFDMLFLTLSDHAGDELRVQLVGKTAKSCAEALDTDGIPSDVILGFIGLVGQPAKGSMAQAWDPKDAATWIVNPDVDVL